MRAHGQKVYGLTGGIASGKSTVAGIFARMGVPVVDADEIARDLRRPGGLAEPAILERFGTLDTKKLRREIFSGPQPKRDLENILHPLIRSESEKKIASFAGKAPFVVYEAALIVESGRHHDFDGLIVVTVKPEIQIRRLMKRDGLRESDACQILASQGEPAAKLAAATEIIENDGSLDELEKKTKATFARISGLI